MLEIDEGVLRPEAVAEVFAVHDFAGSLEENGQNFDGLAVEVQLLAEFKEFAGGGVQLERAEANFATSLNGHCALCVVSS